MGSASSVQVPMPIVEARSTPSTSKKNDLPFAPQTFMNEVIQKAFEYGSSNSLIKEIMNDDETASLFQNFLQSDCFQDNFKFYVALERIFTMEKNTNENSDEVEKLTSDLVDTFLVPGSQNDVSGNLSHGMAFSIRQRLYKQKRLRNQGEDLIDTLKNAQDEVLFLLAMNSLPRFLKSKSYREYVRAKKAESRQLEQIVAGEPLSAPVVEYAKPETPLSLLDSEDKEFLYSKQGSWLSGLFKASESLPICITLSTARKDKHGFPLIHVNKYFETTTGYPRSEIVGSNCRFLQHRKISPTESTECDDTCTENSQSETDDVFNTKITESEPKSIQTLSNALATAKPVKTCITNFKIDGTPFLNLLAMKPIFDSKGEYRYVVGVQFDITRECNTASMLHLADLLMANIPDSIYSLDHE